jgi:hypothetical protein
VFFVFFQAVLIEDYYGVASLFEWQCGNEGARGSDCITAGERRELSGEGLDC